MEIGHTLILGWSEKGMALLQQIALANLSEGGLPIVVLCPENKEDMQNTVLAATLRKKDRLQLHGSRVIFRSGNPINEHDLVRPHLVVPHAYASHRNGATPHACARGGG